MRKLIGPVAVALPAISALGASSASAATEFGDNCVADELVESPITIFEITGAGNPLPTAAPSAGVITKWKVNLIPTPVTVPQTLKVLRVNSGAKSVQVVGEASANIVGGSNSFDTRIPVQAGDRLGLFEGGSNGPLICELPGASLLGAFEGGTGVGATAPFIEIPTEARVPVSAIVEPDADNDGFGDETQDQCPQNAAVQTPCPVAALSVSSVVRKGFARILVTSSVQVPVTVAGKVKLGKGKTAKLSGNTQVVVPGTIAKFTLIFPAGLKSKLKELSRKRSLRLILTATASNIVGAPTVKTLKAKVKGQKKPVRKGKKGKGGKRG
jgi:hypothetical protein